MEDSFYDGSAYDPETVKFYDLAHEGAQVRLLAGLVDSGALRQVEGLAPRSVVVISGSQVYRNCVRVVGALREPMRQPLVLAETMPGYLGALDVLIVLTDDGGDEEALRALITATQRGATTVLVGPPDGPLIDEAPTDTVVVPTLPTVSGSSPARAVASISTVVDLFEEDPRIVSERLQHVADSVDEEIEALSPERDELVNDGRALNLAARDHRIVHTGRTPVGRAIAALVASLWTRAGMISGYLDFPELLAALPTLRGPANELFHDPFLDENSGLLPFKAVVWAEEEPGIPDALAQHCEMLGRGSLAATLRLIVRGHSATVFTSKDEGDF
ncbi:hypothetical protein [Corynebacterium pacaense]|uniref:hypothetical protein n=1 Tax=Corynebacterium pacaense TaxID=1816684 RepID=UPI0009BBD6ED|nr:hypothetical protein [Corynebacterium pacaense]